jgi:hypothetical protein
MDVIDTGALTVTHRRRAAVLRRYRCRPRRRPDWAAITALALLAVALAAVIIIGSLPVG